MKSNFATVDQRRKIFDLIQTQEVLDPKTPITPNALSLEQMRQKSLKFTRLDRKKRSIITHEKFKEYDYNKRTADAVEHDSLTNKNIASVVTNIETGMDDTIRVLKKLKSNHTSLSIYSESFLDFVKSEIENNKLGIGSEPYLFEEDFSGPNIWSTLGKLVSKFKDFKEDINNQNSFELQKLKLDILKEGNNEFIWSVRKAQNIYFRVVPWETRYRDLVEYKKTYGDCKVPSKYNANLQLAVWVMNQRTLYNRLLRGEQSSLSEERRKKLDDIGFVLKVFVAWETRYEELVEYKRLHEDCNVPKLYKANPQLGTWVMNQRTSYKKFVRREKSRLSEEQRKKLDDIGFIWEVGVPAWEAVVPAWEAGVPAWEAGVPTWKT